MYQKNNKVNKKKKNYNNNNDLKKIMNKLMIVEKYLIYVYFQDNIDKI